MPKAIIRRARRYAAGGALDKADLGDFRDSDPIRQAVRAVRDYYGTGEGYADPRGRNVSTALRRAGSVVSNVAAKGDRGAALTETHPAIWETARAAVPQALPTQEETDFLARPPIDRLRARMPGNLPRVGPEAARANRVQNARDLLSIIPGPGNVISAEDAAHSGSAAAGDFSAGRYGSGALNSALALLSGVGAVVGMPTGRLAGDAARGASSRVNMFLGTSAKHADHPALERAREMERKGVDRDTILADTGWFRGVDKRWKWETDDRATGLTDSASINFHGAPRGAVADYGTPPDLFKHPELYRNYEDLAPFRGATELRRGDSDGVYWGKRDEMRVTGADEDTANSIFLHELQHGVQKREGFARGNSALASPQGVKIYNDLRDKYMRELAETRPSMQYAQQFKLASDRAQKRAESVLYVRGAGEVEARNVEGRRNMTPEERRATGPWKTQDVPDEKQIVHGANEPEPWFERSFVPPGNTQLAAIAKSLRELPAHSFNRRGGQNQTIFKETGMFYGPDGGLRREIQDVDMELTGKKFTAGDQAPLRDLMAHDKLYAAQPHAADIPVTFESAALRKAARTDPTTGGFFFPDTFGKGWAKTQIAKLLNYDIANKANYSMPLRHNIAGSVERIDETLAAIQAGIRNETLPAGAALAYMEKLQGDRKKISEAIVSAATNPTKSQWLKEQGFTSDEHLSPKDLRIALSKSLSARNAGNIDADIVKSRVNAPFGYPYENAPAFADQIVLPQHLDTEKLSEFVKNWHKYGAGKRDVPKFAAGGKVAGALKRARKSLAAGALTGETGGRSDKVPTKAAAGSYVIPADVVAALGEGNTLAGNKVLFGRFPGALGRGVKKPRFASGGGVDIIVSDGEFVVTPDDVAELGNGDVDYGHQVLDAFVVNTRKQNIEELKRLPGPKQ